MELRYEFYIGASPEKVWDAFMSPEGTKKIFAGCELRTSFKPGEPFQYVGPGADGEETVHVYGTVLEYDQYKLFSAIEHPGPSYRSNHAELQSRMTFTLETVGSCTKLTLVEDQWTENHPSYESSKSHWWMMLSNIKTLAETGRTLDFGW